jgi:hypothetical protein
MTGTNLATLIRKKTKSTSTTYPDADMLIDVNVFKNEIAARIQRERPNAFVKSYLGNLVLDTRRYYVPIDVMNNMTSLELKFASSGNFVLAKAIKRTDDGYPLQESIIIQNYSNDDPYYFHEGKSFYVLSGSIISVTGGYKIYYNAFPTDLANMTGVIELAITSDSAVGFPIEFQELLARRCSIEYKSINKMALNAVELNYEADLKRAIENFSIPNLDEELTGKLPATDCDNGFDL